jgi:predicted transcriptional regulator
MRTEGRALSVPESSIRFQVNLTEPESTPMTAGFTLRLREETLQALDQLAAKTERSRSWLAVKAIEDHIALNAWQIAKIEAGIAAADRGEFADADDVARVVGKYSARG